MGGINSGRRRSVHRGAVEQFPTIDLRVLKRAGLLQSGQCTYGTSRWRNQDLETLEVRIFIDLSDANDASLRIADDVAVQRVAIERIPCPYGGHRYYFHCPLMGMRCERLFLTDGLWASRKAHRLTYAVQSEDALARARRKERKLSKQLEGDGRYARSRGANRWDLMQRYRAAGVAVNSIYRERLRAMIFDKE